MALSPEEREELDSELLHYPDRRSACIDAMLIVQRYRGWVSDEAVRDIAAYLGMTPSDVDGVATFYNLIYREPVGRHVLLVCNSVSCWIMGCERIFADLTRQLGIQPGQTTPDERFTLLPICCLGACDRAPVMLVEDDLHGPLAPERLPALLDAYK